MNQDKPRWQQRFDNYKRAYFLLQEYHNFFGYSFRSFSLTNIFLIFQIANNGGVDGTRTRDLRRDRPAF